MESVWAKTQPIILSSNLLPWFSYTLWRDEDRNGDISVEQPQACKEGSNFSLSHPQARGTAFVHTGNAFLTLNRSSASFSMHIYSLFKNKTKQGNHPAFEYWFGCQLPWQQSKLKTFETCGSALTATWTVTHLTVLLLCQWGPKVWDYIENLWSLIIMEVIRVWGCTEWIKVSKVELSKTIRASTAKGFRSIKSCLDSRFPGGTA